MGLQPAKYKELLQKQKPQKINAKKSSFQTKANNSYKWNAYSQKKNKKKNYLVFLYDNIRQNHSWLID